MTIIPVLLSELVRKVSESENLSTCMDVFREAEFDVDSWKPGSGFHTLTWALSKGLTNLSDRVRLIARGGYLDLAEGLWLTLLACSWFRLTRRPASYASQTIQLTSAAGAPTYTIVPRQLWMAATIGTKTYRFRNTTGGVLPSGGTLLVTAIAESPGASYNVATGTITETVTALPGVTCSNIATVSEGLDEEKDHELRRRCRLRWATLAAGSPGGMYEFWALTESDGETARAGVTRAYADTTNPGGAGTLHLYVAGPTGGVDANIVGAVDSDVQPRKGVGAILTTASAPETTAAPAGTVWFTGVQAEVEAEAKALLDEYLASLPIGGSVVGSERGVFAEDLEAAIRGATGVVRARITSGDHTMTATQVAIGNWDGILFEAA